MDAELYYPNAFTDELNSGTLDEKEDIFHAATTLIFEKLLIISGSLCIFDTSTRLSHLWKLTDNLTEVRVF